MFENREAAARELARSLRRYAGQAPLVLAVPRGGVPMARILAAELDGDLDVVLVRKLRAPHAPEYAIGAVDEAGRVELRMAGLDEAYVRAEVERQLATLRRRRAAYGASQDPAGRTVIVVDDGVATGATLVAALRSVRARGPARLIAAVGVAPPETARRLLHEADEVVVLETPPRFTAVGQFFADFRQVSDAEVLAHLHQHRQRQVGR